MQITFDVSNFGRAKTNCQTDNFNSMPTFLANTV